MLNKCFLDQNLQSQGVKATIFKLLQMTGSLYLSIHLSIHSSTHPCILPPFLFPIKLSFIQLVASGKGQKRKKKKGLCFKITEGATKIFLKNSEISLKTESGHSFLKAENKQGPWSSLEARVANAQAMTEAQGSMKASWYILNLAFNNNNNNKN